MSKSSFNALVEAKKQRDEVESETKVFTTKAIEDKSAEKKAPRKKEPKTLDSVDNTDPLANARSGKRETVRRSYRVDEAHDKAVKVMSKFMGQGTEEEIVLGVFAYFFENSENGKKAVQMVSLLENN